MGYRNRDLQTRCESLACQLLELQADNERYEDNVRELQLLISNTCCHFKILRNMTVFIKNILRGQFSDPSLLFFEHEVAADQSETSGGMFNFLKLFLSFYLLSVTPSS